MESTFQLNARHASLAELKAHFGNADFKIDLGCGYYKPAGFIGFDNGVGFATQTTIVENAPDVFMDLDRSPLPLDDNSCAVVRASHFLEHSANISHIVGEAHRVLKPDGLLVIIVPYANSAEGMYPGHAVFLTERWFGENAHFMDRFEIVYEKYYPSKYWQQLPRPVRMAIPFGFARKFLFNACWQMELHGKPKGKSA
jgi:predicted SAM-dependent methyltransferase